MDREVLVGRQVAYLTSPGLAWNPGKLSSSGDGRSRLRQIREGRKNAAGCLRVRRLYHR
jgi:hypothetical protein